MGREFALDDGAVVDINSGRPLSVENGGLIRAFQHLGYSGYW